MMSVILLYTLVACALYACAREEESGGFHGIMSIAQNGVDSTAYFLYADNLDSAQCFKYVYEVARSVDCFDSESISRFNKYLKSKPRLFYSDDYGVYYLLYENSSINDCVRLKKYASRIDQKVDLVAMDFQGISAGILYGHFNKYVSELEVLLVKATYSIKDSCLQSLVFDYSDGYRDAQTYRYDKKHRLVLLDIVKYDDDMSVVQQNIFNIYYYEA